MHFSPRGWIMSSQQGARRRTTSALRRALGAACLACATNLTLAFLAPSLDSKAFQRLNNPNTRCRRAGHGLNGCRNGPCQRYLGMLTVMSAVAEAPMPKQKVDSSAGTSLMRRKPLSPLTENEERVLLGKVHQTRILHRLRKELIAPDNLPLSSQEWALEAGLDVIELENMLQEGIEAKQTLVERHMPMVFKIVEEQYRWRLRGGYVSVADLVQEGAYALGVAADRYDPARNNRFLTYAVFIVREKLNVAIARGDMAISVPISALKEFYSAKRSLAAELGRSPSDVELERYFVDGVLDVSPGVQPSGMGPVLNLDGGSSQASESGIMKEPEISLDAAATRRRRRRRYLLSAVGRMTSLDSTIRDSDNGAMSLMDTLAESRANQLIDAENSVVMNLLPQVLTPREAYLVRMACGLTDGRPRTMVECANTLCLSLARTEQLFEASLEKLRLAATLENTEML